MPRNCWTRCNKTFPCSFPAREKTREIESRETSKRLEKQAILALLRKMIYKSEFVGVIKMKCPYCGEEMQLGCIQCRDGVYWSEKERVIAALNIGGGKSIKLNEKSIGGPFGGASAEAWLCEKCKKIVIEY